MPSREEQFDEWFQNASGDELLEAANDRLKESLERQFQNSSKYQEALDDYIVDHLEDHDDLSLYNESVWLDEDALSDDEEEIEEESNIEEGGES